MSIAAAVLFLLVIFLVKNNLLFKNGALGINTTPNSQGLTYKTQTLADLVNKSTVGDGIPDWEKVLLGVDPNQKIITPGEPNSLAIQQIIQQKEETTGNTQIAVGTMANDSASVTGNKTEEFSQSLMASAAALSQNGDGTIDSDTVDQLGSSFADQLANAPQRILYTLSDTNVEKSDTIQNIQKYKSALISLLSKEPSQPTATDILQKFEGDGTNLDVSALSELDPIIKATKEIVNGMLKMNVPPSLALMHLELINKLEHVYENLSDMQLYNADPLASLSAISQYNQNATVMISAMQNLTEAISQKLEN